MTLTTDKSKNLNMQASRDEIITFSYEIERIEYDKDVSYMDAIILYCENIGLEVEIASKLISDTLKSKIKMEAEELHFLPRSNTTKLPL